MSIGTSIVNNNAEVYSSNYATKTDKKTDTSEKKSKTTEKTTSEGAVYEKTTAEKKATYSVNKMNADQRAAIVKQMKADLETRTNQLTSIVQEMLGKQADKSGVANGDDIWKFLAEGNYTVDEAAKIKAQEEISEDGYWGVKQTSQRMFDFASALAGDDVDKMKEMQEAMKKGYEQATKAWGKELPDICKDTIAAADKLFDDYYASKAE